VTASAAGGVDVERQGDVAVLTLRREAKLNALSTALEQALLDALDQPDVASSRVVVITGAGRAFSAGADVTEIRDLEAEAIAAYYRGSGRVYEAVASLPQATISAIHGYCLGAGLELALATDLRVADENAVFGVPEIDLGILPGSGGLVRLVRLLGPARAREMVLLGARVDTTDAQRYGLVTEVAPSGRALDRALLLATRLAAKPALAIAVAKQAIDAAAESSTAAALLVERLAYGMLNTAPDARDRTTAFGQRPATPDDPA
jgi:enoyl-CoA hydratase/carnithine racemase